MIVPHLYLNGRCEEAIAQYVEALGAEVKVLLHHPEDGPQKGVMHAEIYIHGQKIMLNDVGPGSADSQRAPVELVIIFDNAEDLKKSYKIMKEGSRTISPMEETFYSQCVVEFRDRFGVPWGFMVGKSD
jgi:PhnB protein